MELSRTFQTLTEHGEVEEAKNYQSFEKAGAPAEEELERIASLGYAQHLSSWGAVEREVGPGAALTKMGCIQKVYFWVSQILLRFDLSSLQTTRMLHEP